MRATGSRRLRRLTAVAVLSMAAPAVLGSPAHAADTETTTQTVTVDLGDLDAMGTGQIAQFDPALGELTSVNVEATVSMDFAVCVTNRSQESSTINDGVVSGTADLTFAGDVVANTSGELAVPATELAPSTGTDGCSDWLDAGGDGGTQPVGANSSLTAGTDRDTWSSTLTAAAELTPYVGTGTVGFDYAAASASDLTQPAEWTVVFLASGAAEVTVTYTYVPRSSPGNPGNPGNPASGQLPDTGGPAGWLVLLGAGLAISGGAIVTMVRRSHA